ncbi:MAG: hypothetical protein RLZZ111_1841 [Planctomycetota bacterium]
MATSRRQPTALEQVRSLLTAAEQKVLSSSMGAAIAKSSREQVQAAMSRARALRDKWRDLHADQTRSTKRSPKTAAGANRRSKEKHDVFDGAVKRLEARLAELAGGVRAAVTKQAGRLGAATKPTKAARKAANRGSRASLRSELKEAVSGMNRTPKAKGAKVAAKPVAVPVAKPLAAAPAAAKLAPPSRAGKKQKRPVAPAAVAAQRPLKFDVAGQRSARSAATAARLKVEGAKTRRGSHLKASGKRSQARRDGRTR